jgi:transcriptional regulator with XRE-family HTH domain
MILAGIGEILRSLRLESGLSLRGVKDRSKGLAALWGNPSYEVSASWLAKLEAGGHEISVSKLISLATIYSKPPEELLYLCEPALADVELYDSCGRPNTRVLVGAGLLDKYVGGLLSQDHVANPVPDHTMLLPLDDALVATPYRKALVGKRDGALDPMIRPGAILKIDTSRKAIEKNQQWPHDFDRPIYLFRTHQGLLTGWCELDEDGLWLTMIAHPISEQLPQRWRYRKEIEVVGRVVAVSQRSTGNGSR